MHIRQGVHRKLLKKKKKLKKRKKIEKKKERKKEQRSKRGILRKFVKEWVQHRLSRKRKKNIMMKNSWKMTWLVTTFGWWSLFPKRYFLSLYILFITTLFILGHVKPNKIHIDWGMIAMIFIKFSFVTRGHDW